MAERKAFLLRIDPELFDTLSRWAEDELRSLNGQIEYLLRQATVESGRAARRKRSREATPPEGGRLRPRGRAQQPDPAHALGGGGPREELSRGHLRQGTPSARYADVPLSELRLADLVRARGLYRRFLTAGRPTHRGSKLQS